MQPLDERLRRALAVLRRDFETVVPASGRFAGRELVLENSRGKAGEPARVTLVLGGFGARPEYVDWRYFEVRVQSPSGKSTSAGRLYTGCKVDVGEALANPRAEHEIRDFVASALLAMQQDGFA